MPDWSSASADPSRSPSPSERIVSWIAWAIALGLLFSALFLGWRRLAPAGSVGNEGRALANQPSSSIGSSGLLGASQLQASLPEVEWSATWEQLTRRPELHTVIPTRPRKDVLSYTVVAGDSVFEVAARFNLEPESVLWAN